MGRSPRWRSLPHTQATATWEGRRKHTVFKECVCIRPGTCYVLTSLLSPCGTLGSCVVRSDLSLPHQAGHCCAKGWAGAPGNEAQHLEAWPRAPTWRGWGHQHHLQNSLLGQGGQSGTGFKTSQGSAQASWRGKDTLEAQQPWPMCGHTACPFLSTNEATGGVGIICRPAG